MPAVVAMVMVVLTVIVLETGSFPVIMPIVHVLTGYRVEDIELGSPEPLPQHFGGPNLESFQAEAFHVASNRFQVGAGVKERSYEHVAADSGEGVQIKDPFHANGSFRLPPAASLLIMSAWQAAPNPLSIFTTLTPVAQELSMARSAVTPPKLAP